MWTINPNALRNDVRTASGDGTVIIVKGVDLNGEFAWSVRRNVYAGHKSAGKVYGRNITRFDDALALATAIAGNE